MIDYTKLDVAHKLAAQYQLMVEDDVSIAVVFRSNYIKYSLITHAEEESYTSIDGLIGRLVKITRKKDLTEWEIQVAKSFQFQFPMATDDDWRTLARVIEEQMQKLDMLKKVETYQKSQGAWLGSLVKDMFPPAEITPEEQATIDRHSKIHDGLFELQCDVDRKMAELPALKEMLKSIKK